VEGIALVTACDSCRRPGRCCTGFNITGRAPAHWHPLEVYVWLATVRHRDEAMGDTGLPFMPLWPPPTSGHWRFWCPRLGRDGRCTDYDNRPTLCRIYEPGHDGLCAIHEGWYPPAAQSTS
jgi:Fe-S-cluster containining protein